MTGIFLGAVLAAAVALALVIAASARQDPGLTKSRVFTCDITKPPKFAGYASSSKTPLTEIGAEWRAPSLAGSSSGNRASAWIGLEATKGASLRAFVQVGTYATVNPLSSETPPASYRYGAFWSSNNVHDDERRTLVVAPGDLIKAEIRRARSSLTLLLTDVTSGRRSDVRLSLPVGTTFTKAAWLEEDTSPRGCTQAPVPTTSAVSFRDVKLDHTDAHFGYGDALTMFSPNGIVLVPSRVRDAGFTISPVAGRAGQFLAGIDPAVEAWRSFLAEATKPSSTASLTSNTVKAIAASAGEQLLTDVVGLRRRMIAQPWPPRARTAVRRFVSDSRALMSSLRTSLAHFQRTDRWALTGVVSALGRESTATSAVERAFGLPSATPTFGFT